MNRPCAECGQPVDTFKEGEGHVRTSKLDPAGHAIPGVWEAWHLECRYPPEPRTEEEVIDEEALAALAHFGSL